MRQRRRAVAYRKRRRRQRRFGGDAAAASRQRTDGGPGEWWLETLARGLHARRLWRTAAARGIHAHGGKTSGGSSGFVWASIAMWLMSTASSRREEHDGGFT
ncbi:hypothetical protein DY000_02021892 [Brassica cretica]|uniref:Uncharacterized protein n=1 Tax=Brassica cretica TaxID=69181 RepID=A0ABQ7EIF4_BRACR|nr:hypothetical protein DY000_02021892 [Brassica cretica]